MTGLKDKASRTQQLSTCSTHWRCSQKCQALGNKGHYMAQHYRISSSLASRTGDVADFPNTQKQAQRLRQNEKKDKLVPNERTRQGHRQRSK